MSAPAIGPGTLCRFLGPSGPDLPAVGSVWVCEKVGQTEQSPCEVCRDWSATYLLMTGIVIPPGYDGLCPNHWTPVWQGGAYDEAIHGRSRPRPVVIPVPAHTIKVRAND